MKLSLPLVVMICLLPIISADLFPTPTEIVTIGFGGGSGQTGVNVFIPDEIFNSSAVTSNSTEYWITSIGALNNVDAVQHNNVGGVLTIDETYLDSSWLRRDGGNSPTANINWNNKNITNISSIHMSNEINIEIDDPNFENSSINIINNADFGISSIKLANSREEEFFLAMVGHNLSQVLFEPGTIGINDSVMGLSGDGALLLSTLNNKSIVFGSSPTGFIPSTNWFLKLNPVLQSMELQKNKFIRPVTTDGVQTMTFESNVGAAEGELTFMFVGSDFDNNSVVQSANQIGKNNSASIQGMNSQIVASKDYLTMPDDVKVQFDNNTGDPIIEEWFSNITSCFIYEEYLQGLPSFDFIKEGLASACDSVGQGVPTSILGYVESIGPFVGHGGGLFYDNLNYISREDNDFNVIGADIHVRKEQIVTGNFTNSTQTICDFDAGNLCDFVSESIAPEIGRDWDNVIEPECHSSGCANAKGGNLKIMCENTDYSNLENINLSFWLSVTTTVNDEFYIELDNNIGTVTQVFSETTDVDDEHNSFLFPPAFEDQPNVTMCIYWDGTSIARESWVDEIMYFADLIVPGIINQTELQGAAWYGENGDSPDKCGINVFFETNETTQDVQKVLEVGCPTGLTRILGSVEQIDVTIIDQNITGNQIITGNSTVGDTFITDRIMNRTSAGINISSIVRINELLVAGENISSIYFRLDGTTPMQGNANWGGFNLSNVSWINGFNMINGSGDIITTGNIDATNLTTAGIVNHTLSSEGNFVVNGDANPFSVTGGTGIEDGNEISRTMDGIFTDSVTQIIRVNSYVGSMQVNFTGSTARNPEFSAHRFFGEAANAAWKYDSAGKGEGFPTMRGLEGELALNPSFIIESDSTSGATFTAIGVDASMKARADVRETQGILTLDLIGGRFQHDKLGSPPTITGTPILNYIGGEFIGDARDGFLGAGTPVLSSLGGRFSSGEGDNNTGILIQTISDAKDLNIGLDIEDISGSTNNYAIRTQAGDWLMDEDNAKFFQGESQESSIYYNGTDKIYNSQEVGSGKHIFIGDVVLNSTGASLSDAILNNTGGGYNLIVNKINATGDSNFTGDLYLDRNGGVQPYISIDFPSQPTTFPTSSGNFTIPLIHGVSDFNFGGSPNIVDGIFGFDRQLFIIDPTHASSGVLNIIGQTEFASGFEPFQLAWNSQNQTYIRTPFNVDLLLDIGTGGQLIINNDIHILNDNDKTLRGANEHFSIYSNGSDAFYNSQEVGSGKHYFIGDVILNGTQTSLSNAIQNNTDGGYIGIIKDLNTTSNAFVQNNLTLGLGTNLARINYAGQTGAGNTLEFQGQGITAFDLVKFSNINHANTLSFALSSSSTAFTTANMLQFTSSDTKFNSNVTIDGDLNVTKNTFLGDGDDNITIKGITKIVSNGTPTTDYIFDGTTNPYVIDETTDVKFIDIQKTITDNGGNMANLPDDIIFASEKYTLDIPFQGAANDFVTTNIMGKEVMFTLGLSDVGVQGLEFGDRAGPGSTTTINMLGVKNQIAVTTIFRTNASFPSGKKVRLNLKGIEFSFSGASFIEELVNDTLEFNAIGGEFSSDLNYINTGEPVVNFIAISAIAEGRGNRAFNETTIGLLVDASNGRKENIGIKIINSDEWGIWDESSGNWNLNQSNKKIMWQQGLANITQDSSGNMVFTIANNGTGDSNAVFDFNSNVTATGFVTKTSTYDKTKGSALDYIKDADDYKNPDGSINHSAFEYSKTSWQQDDLTKPIIEERCIEQEKLNPDWSITNETICKNYIIGYTQKVVEGVSLEGELDIFRQSIFELKQENINLKNCILNSKDFAEAKVCIAG